MEKEKKLQEVLKKNIRWIVLAVFTILFINMLEQLFENEIHFFDNHVYQFISQFISPMMTKIAKVITLMGSAYVIVPICLLSFLWFWKKKESNYVCINLLMNFLLNQLLKKIIARPRPEGFRIVEESGYSFPSGHSMVSMAFYGLFIYFIYNKVTNPYLKWVSIALLSMLIIGIGISRIYLGVHYASDVLAGFSVSICYLIIFTKIISLKE